MLEYLIYRYSCHIVAFSDGIYYDIIRFKSISAEKVSVVLNGSSDYWDNASRENVFFPRVPLSENDYKRVLIYCGTIGRMNNVEYIVDLAERLKRLDPSVKIIIVGAGNKIDCVKNYAISKNVLDQNLYFLGPQSIATANYLLRKARAALIVCRNDPFIWSYSMPNKFFDAIGAGVPVIVNHRTGVKADYVSKKSIGVCIDSSDISGAAFEIVDYLNKPEIVDMHSRNCRELHNNETSRRIIGKHLLEIIRRCSY